MRIEALRIEMEAAGFDGYLATNWNNVYYFTDFLDVSTAQLYLLVPFDETPVLYVHELNFDLAKEKVKNCIVKQVKMGEKMHDKLLSEVESLKLRKIGFDGLRVSTYLNLKKKLKRIRFQQNMEIIWRLRRVKDEKELGFVKKAAELTDIGVEAAIRAIKPGIREYEVAAKAEYSMRIRGSEGTAFETLVASGPRSAIPHGVSTDRRLKKGDLVVIDLGATYRGYRSDLTRTVVLGKPSRKQVEIFQLVLEAQERAFNSIRSHTQAKNVDAVARKIIEKGGYGGYFIHGLGHGIGLDVHEPPRLSPTSKDVLEERNVVTDEPAVYIPSFGGVRIEDTVLVLRGRAKRLTKSPRDLI